MKRLRLVKVVVQPVFVIDDGADLTELRADPVEVSAQEWPRFAEGRFREAMEALREQIERTSEDVTPERPQS